MRYGRSAIMDQAAVTEVDMIFSLKAALIAKGMIPKTANWEQLSGGRTNRVWRITGPKVPLICRLGLPQRDTPLFPNISQAQEVALAALAGTGLAPEHSFTVETKEGHCLIYPAVAGKTWRHGADDVGFMLARLHQIAPPQGLRVISTDPSVVMAQGDAMMHQGAMAARLSAMRPCEQLVPKATAVFLHGDPVPGNIIVGPSGCVLIDWQCPAQGDAAYDLALFLSPAMQILGRGTALCAKEREEFLSAYQNPAMINRLALVEPALSWRMACYCTWRMARGHADYAPALDAELRHLEHLC